MCITTEDRDGVRFPKAGVAGGCELQCQCWELNLGPLQEQQVLLTAEPSLQPPGMVHFYAT